jgi:hypothetical protein
MWAFVLYGKLFVRRQDCQLGTFQDRAEELIYRLNEADHWIFRLYDWGNEVFAAIRLSGVRRRYATIPVDNQNSVRMANAAGWQVIRTNRRFHVLRWSPDPPPGPRTHQ